MHSPPVFCTLFDTRYLSRGLAMIESLVRHEPRAKVVVFPFDSTAESVLRQLAWPEVEIVPLSEFETPELLAVKTTRQPGEYCWTCTPFTILHCLTKLGYEACTYVDADLFFFHSTDPAFDEEPRASVLLTDHRYTAEYDQTKTSGRFCVQFMFFRNNPEGLTALQWWADRCLEWCYARVEDGKFGDQKYLDDWLTRFSGVHDIRHEGVGVAPWNIQQYGFTEGNDTVQLQTRSGGNKPVVFYHFHALKILPQMKVDLGPYALPESARRLIYRPYVAALMAWQDRLKMQFGIEVAPTPTPKLHHRFRRWMKGALNITSAQGV